MAERGPVQGNSRALAGVLFLAAVDASYNAYSALNSSPQTTELFAAEREETLMKYVYIGNGAAAFLGALGSWISRSWWPLLGTVFVMGQMHWLYRYAAACGKRKGSGGSLLGRGVRSASSGRDAATPVGDPSTRPR